MNQSSPPERSRTFIENKSNKRSLIFVRLAHDKLVTASKTKRFGADYRAAAEWARRYLQRQKIEHSQYFITGDPATVFVEEAGSDHIIVMGKSKMHPLKAWLKGTKPGDTLLKANCPVILVK